MGKGNVLLCAGGTGGHLFPAEAVAHELVARGYTVHLAADDRVQKYADRFPAEEIHQIKSATFASKNPVALLKTAFALYSGYKQSVRLLAQLKPVVVAGFGGYPTVPPLLAATRANIPTLVHDSNAVLGRANRMLGKRVNTVATGFGNAANVGDIAVTVTGNPVRPTILEVAKKPYPARKAGEPFHLLVFGGSQGAAFFSDAIPAAIGLLPDDAQKCVRVVQQARPEDLEEVRTIYRELGVEAEVETFFSDMDKRLSKAHLVISRAGASTVSELAVMGRPAILVPYPFALDHDQAANAAAMAEAGGAALYKQADLSPQVLADELSNAIEDPKKLAISAENAKKTGKPEATIILADMLEQLARQ